MEWTVTVTASNVHDSQLLGDLLHGDDTHVWGDSAYAGQKRPLYEKAPNAKDFTQKKGSCYCKLTEAGQSANRQKSKIRSRVEHVSGVMKRHFGFTKARYRGLNKNAQFVFTRCALVNLMLAKKALLVAWQESYA